jgi:hypothetical protein
MMRLFPVILLFSFCGCARYEFEVLEPPEFATHVGRKKETAADVRREPLDYHMRAYDGRLVMNIFNNDEQPIDLLGDQSYVVDPDGESHPLPSAAIAPDAYIKLIFPPLRPYYPREPHFGFGIGIGVSHFHHNHHRHFRGPRFRHFFDPDMTGTSASRTYFYQYDPGTLYWAWEKESAIRLRLTYRRQNDEIFHHEFVIRRVRV